MLATLLRGPYRQARVHLTGTPYRKSTSPGPTSDFPHPAPLLVSVRQITHWQACSGVAGVPLLASCGGGGGGGGGHWRRAGPPPAPQGGPAPGWPGCRYWQAVCGGGGGGGRATGGVPVRWRRNLKDGTPNAHAVPSSRCIFVTKLTIMYRF